MGGTVRASCCFVRKNVLVFRGVPFPIIAWPQVSIPLNSRPVDCYREGGTTPHLRLVFLFEESSSRLADLSTLTVPPWDSRFQLWSHGLTVEASFLTVYCPWARQTYLLTRQEVLIDSQNAKTSNFDLEGKIKARECQIPLLLIDKFRSPVGRGLKYYDFRADNNAALRAWG